MFCIIHHSFSKPAEIVNAYLLPLLALLPCRDKTEGLNKTNVSFPLHYI